MQRLRLAGIRMCERCNRGSADLVTDDGTRFKVPLDPFTAQELANGDDHDEAKPLSALVIAQLLANGAKPCEVVFDAEDGVLRGLLSFTHDDEPEVVTCTPQDGVALAMRGGLKFYATDEALAHVASEQPLHDDSDDSAH